MKNYLSLLSGKTKVRCVGIVILAIIGSFLASTWPVYLGKIYTAITDGQISNLSQGVGAIAVFGIIVLLSEIISISRRVMIDCTISSQEADLKSSSIEKLLKMPVAFYSGSLSGERTAQMNQGVAGLSALIKIICNDVATTIFIAVCTIFQVVINAPSLMGILMATYLGISLILSLAQIHSQNGIREKIIRLKNSLDGQICQSIANLELIRSMSAEKFEKNRLRPSIDSISGTEQKHHLYMGAYDCAKQFSKILFHVIILIASVVMIHKNQMTPGSVITVCLLFQQLLKPIDDVYHFMDEIASSLVKAKVLTEVSTIAEDPIFSIVSQENEKGQQTDRGTDIVFRDVTVTNPEKDQILAVYERIRIPGQGVVALKGASGCGKTTMMRCLNRFYPYVKGGIEVFGRDLFAYSQEELTECLYYTPQKPFFFAGSIRENLTYGIKRTISSDELVNALQKACLFKVLCGKVSIKIDSKSDDVAVLAYQIGEGGKGLSGGECQRLSIARAFLRTPKLFIFDESTANLDADTAQKVLKNVEAHAKKIGAGVVYISHDRDVVNRCKSSVMLENLVKQQAAA